MSNHFCPECWGIVIDNWHNNLVHTCSKEILDAVTKPFFTEEEIKKLQEDDGTKRAMNINLFEFNRKINSNNQ